MGETMTADKLGLSLGALVVILTIVFVAVFSRWGLPKDPKEFKRIQQMESTGMP
jgi:hypothetical protein